MVTYHHVAQTPTGNAVADVGLWIPRLTAGATPRASHSEKRGALPLQLNELKKSATAFPQRSFAMAGRLAEFCIMPTA